LPLAEGRTGIRSNFARRFTQAMMAAWGETSKEEEGSQKEEATVALMAESEYESKFKSLS